MIIFFIIFLLAAAVIVFIFVKSMQIPGKLKRAEELLTQGRLSEAGAIIKSVLDKQKDNIRAHYLRARMLQDQNQYLLAISEYNAVLNMPEFRLYVPELSIHYALAEMYGATNNYQKQIEEYRLVLSLNPDDLNANVRLGLVLYRKKDYKKAKDAFLKVMQIAPKHTECLLPLGISLYNIGDNDRAEEYLLKALDVVPGNSEAQYYLGCIYKHKHANDTAVSMFNEAKKDPTYYIKSLKQIGEIYFNDDRYQAAIDVLEPGLDAVSEKTEEGCDYRYLLADCYEASGRIREAIKCWEAIVKYMPDFRNAKANLDGYKIVASDDNLMDVFSIALDDLQPYVAEIIAGFNYNIISQEQVSATSFAYKAYNIKRIGDPPVLVMFNRTPKEVTEFDINEFYQRMQAEKCKNGIYLATASFSPRASAIASSRQIEIYDGKYIGKAFEKIKIKQLR